jgi:hypothetical protein
MRYIKLNEEEINKKLSYFEYINTFLLLLNSGALIGILYYCLEFDKTANSLETLDIDKINSVVNTFSNNTIIAPYIYNFAKIIDWVCKEVPNVNCSNYFI